MVGRLRTWDVRPICAKQKGGRLQAAPFEPGQSRSAEQIVLHREQHGACPAAHADLAVDVLEVMTDGVLAQKERLGDLPPSGALGSRPQDLHLAGGEPGRPRLATRPEALS